MITRHGKIARLPHDVREELNQRLYNGAMGPELLPWLNQLPAVKEILAQFFNGAPVNAQNLSDWRHGGYEDWSRHQERELRIQRITEEGTHLAQREQKADLFENFARIAVAELAVDMDSLAQMDGEQRWNRLRGLTRELARLQNGYNRSRWAALAWTKWNDRFEEPPELAADDADLDVRSHQTENVPQPVARNELLKHVQPETFSPSPPLKGGEGRGEEALRVQGEDHERAVGILPAEPKIKENAGNPALNTTENTPKNSHESPAFKVDQAASNGEEADPRVSATRIIYHRKNCGCVCKICHPEHGEYPHAEAVRDTMEARQHGAFSFWRGTSTIVTEPKICNCACAECAAKAKTPNRHFAY